MIIIGNVPDKFDSMPYAYGVDNKIIFDKRVYNELTDIVHNTIDPTPYSAKYSYTNEHGAFDVDYYINGEIFLYWKYFYRMKHPQPDIYYSLIEFYYCGRIFLFAKKMVWNDSHYIHLDEYYIVNHDGSDIPYSIEANDVLNKYAKDNNIPFFFYETKGVRDSYIELNIVKKYIPIQTIRYDFGGVDRLYNDIYNQLSSYKNDDDIIQVSNDDKIRQAGFDLKKSFRK